MKLKLSKYYVISLKDPTRPVVRNKTFDNLLKAKVAIRLMEPNKRVYLFPVKGIILFSYSGWKLVSTKQLVKIPHIHHDKYIPGFNNLSKSEKKRLRKRIRKKIRNKHNKAPKNVKRYIWEFPEGLTRLEKRRIKRAWRKRQETKIPLIK